LPSTIEKKKKKGGGGGKKKGKGGILCVLHERSLTAPELKKRKKNFLPLARELAAGGESGAGGKGKKKKGAHSRLAKA